MKKVGTHKAITVFVFVVLLIVSSLFTVAYKQVNDDATDQPSLGITSLLYDNPAPNLDAVSMCMGPMIYIRHNSVGLPFVHTQHDANSCTYQDYRISPVAFYLDLLIALGFSCLVGFVLYRLRTK